MIRVLTDVSAVAGGWSVTISSPVLDAPITRFMPRLGEFPAAASLPAGLADAALTLATAQDPAVIDAVRVNLAARQPDQTDTAAFGAYLHAALFGGAWADIEQRAAGQSIELALRWPVTEWELARLPWELMRAPDAATGQWSPLSWRAAVTRIIPCERQQTTIQLRPKVLFIVGTDLNDVSIRPGAEFFTVWERLQQAGISFDFRILQRASSQQIEDEIESFAPSIVHFICHGQDAGGSGVINLTSTDRHGRLVTDQRDAQGCLDLLRSKANTYPPVVVLSACYSGSNGHPVASRVDAPLAAALVEGGVPIVVGMGGQISDLACRLFARRFYEALLRNEPVTAATFEGRRAGMKHGSGTEASVDWALPMLFLAEGIDPVVEVDAGDVTRVAQRVERARRLRDYPTPPNPAAFCDRIEVMEAQRALTAPGQRTRILVLEETDAELTDAEGDKLSKFGKTRVLRELAARFVLHGELPCLVTFMKPDQPPTSAGKLLSALGKAVVSAPHLLGCETRIASQLKQLTALVAGGAHASAGKLDEVVRDEYEMWCAERTADGELPASLIGAALRSDLQALAALGRTQWEAPDLRVVVLVDDVHKFDAATSVFLQLVGPDGLGSIDQPVPLIFAFSSLRGQDGYQNSIESLRKFVEDNTQGSLAAHVELGRFKSTDLVPFSTESSPWQDPLALVYRQYLLNLSPGIVLRPEAQPQAASYFLNWLHAEVQGIPSRLYVSSRMPQAAQRVVDRILTQQERGLYPPTIERIDDEKALAEFRSLVPWT